VLGVLDIHQSENASAVAGLQGILASLQRIELSLDGQWGEAASLRKVLEAKLDIGSLKWKSELFGIESLLHKVISMYNNDVPIILRNLPQGSVVESPAKPSS
jgi:hypothetical protein